MSKRKKEKQKRLLKFRSSGRLNDTGLYPNPWSYSPIAGLEYWDRHLQSASCLCPHGLYKHCRTSNRVDGKMDRSASRHGCPCGAVRDQLPGGWLANGFTYLSDRM